jgi:hypothetical protein
MGLCYETSRWLDRLWSEHLDLSTTARQLVEAGIKKQGETFAGFPADLHARLYLPRDPKQREGPEWATRLHELASELAEWQRLRGMCARSGFAAGIAAEAMLSHLLPLVPEKPQKSGTKPQDSPNIREGGDHAGSDNDAADVGADTPGFFPAIPEADLRAALRRATREARVAVQQAEAELEGMSTSLGLSVPSTAVVEVVEPLLRSESREVVLVLPLDTKRRLICPPITVAVGTIDSVPVHPRELFRPLIRVAASAVILVHLHPSSGEPVPSPDDILLTSRLKEAGELLGIPVLDHVVIGHGTYMSMADHGLMKY